MFNFSLLFWINLQHYTVCRLILERAHIYIYIYAYISNWTYLTWHSSRYLPTYWPKWQWPHLSFLLDILTKSKACITYYSAALTKPNDEPAYANEPTQMSLHNSLFSYPFLTLPGPFLSNPYLNGCGIWLWETLMSGFKWRDIPKQDLFHTVYIFIIELILWRYDTR